MVDRVHAGDHRRQHLRRADVRRRLLAPDVLLARLQREAVGRVAVRVDADADQAAGQRALELVAAGEVGGVRAAVAHRHAEALRVADDDVGAELAGRHQQRQREQVGGDDRKAAPLAWTASMHRRAGRAPRRSSPGTAAAPRSSRRRRPRPLLGGVGERDRRCRAARRASAPPRSSAEHVAGDEERRRSCS